MHIRLRFLLGMGALGLLIVLLASDLALDAMTKQTAALQAERQVSVLAAALKAAEKITLERLKWNSLLDLPSALTDETSGPINATVAETDAVLAEASAAFASIGSGPSVLHETIEHLQAMRSFARAAATKAKPDRLPDVQRRNIEGFAEAARHMNRDTAALENQLGAVSYAVAARGALARLSQDFRNVNGQRSALMYLSLQPSSTLEHHVVAMTELTGRVAELWDEQRLTVQQLGSPPSLTAAVEQIAHGAMEAGETRLRSMIQLLREGRRPTETPTEFRAWTVPLLQQTLVVRDAALAEAKDAAHILFAAARLRLTVAIGSVMTAGIIMLATIWFLLSRVVGPVQRLTAAVTHLSQSDLQGDLPNMRRQDEIGAMIRAVAALRDGAVRGRAADAAIAAAQTARLQEAERLLGLCTVFETVADTATQALAQTAEDMRAMAAGLEGNATANVAGALDAETSVESAAVAVAAVAARTAALAASIEEITRQMQEASTASQEIAQQTMAADSIVGRLAEAANRVGTVVQLIDGIAGRTKMLALNAAIEAARAGAMGHSFAVVAGEVKGLAQQTTKAIADVGGEVAAMQDAASAVVHATRAITIRIERMTAAATAIANATDEQRAATGDVAEWAQRATSGTSIASLTARAARQRAGTAQTDAAQVAMRAREVGLAATQLRQDVATFLAGIRTA